MSHILISAAVDEELSLLEKELRFPVNDPVGGRRRLYGNLDGKSVSLLTTGVGIVNTAQALTSAIEDSRPQLLIQTGSAGAFQDSGMTIGDIGIAEAEVDVHLGIEPEHESEPLTDLPFPIIRTHFKQKRALTNRYPVDSAIVHQVFNILKQAKSTAFNILKGVFITVSTVTATDKRAKRLFEQYCPIMESMEGSGAAHIAIHYDLPFLEIRSASNYVGKRDRNSWNLPIAYEQSAWAVKTVIRNIAPLLFLKIPERRGASTEH